MSAPFSTTGASSESNAWHELEDVFARLGRLARSAAAPHEFYQALLDGTVPALSAAGGAVWLRAADATFRQNAQIGWPIELSRDDASRRQHDALLSHVAQRGKLVRMAPHAVHADHCAANPTEHVLLLAPVADHLQCAEFANIAVIAVLLPSDATPAAYRGCEQFLTAVCELAADYHAFAELHALHERGEQHAQLLRLSSLAHRPLGLTETAYTIANEGRRVVGCDRLTVVAARPRGAKLLATSAVSRVERRSGAVRHIEQLADLVRRTDEPAFYADGHSDALPPVAEALELLAEESHARQIAAVPLRRPATPPDDSTAAINIDPRRQVEPPQFVLIAEQFDARHGDLSRERLVEVGEVCSTALYNALEYERLPLVWLLRPVGELKHKVTAHLSRMAILCGAVAATIAALVFVPADFDVAAPGTLQPAVRRDVFAPRSALVDEVLIAHGADVAAGQPLVRLRDPALELELQRAGGEIATTQRQIDAVRATRTNRAVRDANPTDAYRLSAEERELEQRLANLSNERALLQRDREQLVVASPIAGRVLSWDLGHRLVARPVERGEVLISVADLSADWQLELAVPDDRIGNILAAQQQLRPELPVTFRLSSDDREQHTGHVVEVSQTADVAAGADAARSPTVTVKVAFDELALGESFRRELRPGVSARAQIACGRRSIGYVWLHDLWDAALEWLWF